MNKMREMGYEMVAVSSPGCELDELREVDGFKTYAVSMARHISVISDVRSLFNMISVFRKERPQVVHSMTPKAGLICMLAAWLTRVPVRIHTFTGLVWPTATGLKRRILMSTDWLTCACATHIIPEGQGVMNDLRNGGITKKPMKVLGYGNVRGVDMERFKGGKGCAGSIEADASVQGSIEADASVQGSIEADASVQGSIEANASVQSSIEADASVQGSMEADASVQGSMEADASVQSSIEATKPFTSFTFLFVGRIVGDKGINELVVAFGRLQKKYKGVRLMLVGEYEENLDPVKVETREEIERNSAIMECGVKNGDDLLIAYNDADCFVMPSYREGFPNTVLEAGAMGLPCIVTDINGSREIIEEGKNGLIVAPKDSDALYAAMERMLTDDTAREEMQRNARPMIESRFEKGFVQKCLIDYYKEILK